MAELYLDGRIITRLGSGALARALPRLKEPFMRPQFIRILREREDKEILINVNSIWKIEIEYVMRPTKPGEVAGRCSLRKGIVDPDAIRIYTVFAGNDKFKLAANPGSEVMQVLEKLYKNAVVDE